MAYTLIHVERGLYSERAVRPPTVWRKWEVEKKIQETDDVVTFVFKRRRGPSNTSPIQGQPGVNECAAASFDVTPPITAACLRRPILS
jgi:hypothetical protein